MILQKEIATIATEKGVVKSTIDKNWALGHFLDAIFSISELREKLIFKGGTCIRKCYLPDYRFSEDLDFTSNDKAFRLTIQHLTEITRLLKDRVEMHTHIESIKDLKYRDELVGFEAIIKFWGADHPRNEAPPPPERWQTKVKMEMILYEVLLFPIQKKDVIHLYSDNLTNNAKQIPCYSIEEVLSEKLRSLVQRSYSAPRDIYDLWSLSETYKELDLEELRTAFERKMEFKELAFTGIDQLLNSENDKSLRAAWKNSLGHQIAGDLPDYDTVRQKLKDWFSTFLDGDQ
jgi:predicted nucleotidyltransferase component of viral defense system